MITKAHLKCFKYSKFALKHNKLLYDQNLGRVVLQSYEI